MEVAIALLFGLAVTGAVVWISRLPVRQPEVLRRLNEFSGPGALSTGERRKRQARREKMEEILQNLGGRLERGRADRTTMREFLLHAGYSNPNAVAVYLGIRLVAAIGLAAGVLALIPLLRLAPALAFFGAVWGFLVGWLVPAFVVGAQARRRQKEMIRALPDALDLMVVCVEAGLALNQAMVRVAEEIGNVSLVLSEQLAITNFEIRAGTPRADALRNFADRTGVDDIRTFVTMLVQTDRFGTSVADALRVHADTLRVKRRQRAEEAAAKTAIKMLFPLVFFIFPAMFVVILTPALISIIENLSAVR